MNIFYDTSDRKWQLIGSKTKKSFLFFTKKFHILKNIKSGETVEVAEGRLGCTFYKQTFIEKNGREIVIFDLFEEWKKNNCYTNEQNTTLFDDVTSPTINLIKTGTGLFF